MTEPLNNTRHLTASSPLAMDITAENLLQIGAVNFLLDFSILFFRMKKSDLRG